MEGMEDVHAIRHPAEEFFAAEVYDGHCGSAAAGIAARVLTPYFESMRKAELDKPAKGRRAERALLREAYLRTDRYYCRERYNQRSGCSYLLPPGEEVLGCKCGGRAHCQRNRRKRQNPDCRPLSMGSSGEGED
jgi:hypothetical protein